MKKVFLFILSVTGMICNGPLRAQVPTCDPSVPFYQVNLVGQPAGSWTSPVHSRNGNCCSTSSPDRCTSFEILLDTGAAMISFEIASGAIPSGSMFYQISCGPPVQVGQPICITGPGPHFLTFCKPGNNTNTYRVTSIPKPIFPKDDTARIGCSLPLHILGLVQSSITWNSVFPGAPGAYNSYLSCVSNCDTVLYTPASNAPAYVDYVMCGTPIATACGYVALCDTVRIYNFAALSGSITPDPATFCQGGPGVTLTGSGSGGQAPYSYTWYNQSLQVVGTTSSYNATTGENYQLEIRDVLYDSLYCPSLGLNAPVTATLPPSVDAGPDQTVCPVNPAIVLNGTVLNATGGIWTGGAGTFNPSNTSLFASYTPTPAEISAGQVTLTLTSTGAGGGCTDASDAITIHFPAPLVVNVTNANTGCNGNTATLNSVVSGGTAPYAYQWNNGDVTPSITTTAGIYCLSVIDSLGCVTSSCGTISTPASLNIITSSTPCSTNGGSDGTASASVSGGTAPYTYLWSNSGTTSSISGLSYGIYTVVVTDANGCQIASSVVVNEPRCNGFQVSATGTNINCFGSANGSATASVISGTPSYTYLWNDALNQTTAIASGLSAGVYQCLITDANSCAAVANVTLTQPAQLTSTMTHTNVSTIGGNNGTAQTTIGGGTPAYTYMWNNGETSSSIDTLTAGMYSVLVTDANNCTLEDSVLVTQPPCNNLTLSVVTTPVSCPGGSDGSASAIILFGTNPISYLWSTSSTASSVSGLSAGNYNLVITDGSNCSTFVNFSITEPSPLTLGLSPTNVSCSQAIDGTIELTVNGGTYPYDYSWSNGAQVEDLIHLTNGSYSVTVTDAHGCTASGSTVITRPAPIVATSVNTKITCYGGSNGAINATVSGGISPYTYSWSSGETTEDISGLSAGNYILTVTDANNCVIGAPFDVSMNEPGIVHIDSMLIPCPVPGSGHSQVIIYPGGGNPGSYQVSFDNGNNFLGSGVYTDLLPADSTYLVMVRDTFGCVMPVSDSLVIHPVVDIQSVSFNPCIGDGITSIPVNVNVTGGNGSLLSVSFDNGVTYLPAGTYSTQLATGNSYTIMAQDSNSCTSVPETISIPDEIILSGTTSSFAGGNQVSCFGNSDGSINLSVTGGTGAHTYNWSNNGTTEDLSGIPAGTYSVIVTDSAACSDTITFILAEPALLSNTLVAATSFNGYGISCNGAADAAVDLTISGGVASYTYAWSNSASTEDLSNLGAGVYSVIVTDANGCVTTNTITISEPALLTAGIISQRVFCNGNATGAADLTVNGGVTPYVYAWNNSAVTEDISSLTAGSYSVSVTDANGCTASASTIITQPTPVVLSSSITNLSCFQSGNGAIDLTVNGGLVPYTFAWSNSAVTEDLVNISAGSYSVTVLDSAGCTSTLSFTITEPALLTATAIATTNFNGYNVSCSGSTDGGIDLTVSGGTQVYTYSWSNSASTEDLSNLGAGIYSVIVTDANGCAAADTVTISEPALLAAGIVSQRVFCNGNATGAADLTVTGGVTPYVYAWNNSAVTEDISSLTAGSYSVSVTDANGCTASASTIITQPTPVVISTSVTDLSCFQSGNGAINLSVSGGLVPYTFQWSNSATTEDLTNIPAGTYSVTVLDSAACSSTLSFTVNEPALLATAVTAITNYNGYNVSCFGSTDGGIDLTVSGGTQAYTYSWSHGATTEDVSGLGAGSYTVTVTDLNGCTSVSSIILSGPAVLTNSFVQQNVFCNGNNTGSIDLTVNGGVTPYSYAWNNSAITEDLSSLPAGTYSVNITDANGCTSSASAVISQAAAIVVNGSASDLTCFQSGNGAIDLTVTGGILPYSYQWSNTAVTEDLSNIGAGSYSVTVLDSAGCMNTLSFTITQPLQLTASAVSSLDYNGFDVSCAGSSNGAADLTVSGGTQGYTYSWSNGASTEDISAVSAGTYTVAVTDVNGCSANATVILTEPAALDINASHQDVPCNGFFTGSINITISGGVQPMNYLWSNSATTEDINGLSSGTYSVVVTDANGCAIDSSVEITEASPVIVSGTSAFPLCSGDENGSVDLTVTGGTLPYSYNWSNGATSQDLSSLGAGSYSVIVADSNNCIAHDTFLLAQPSQLSATINSPLQANGHNVSAYGGHDGSVNLEVTGGSLPYQYNWSNGSTTQDLSGVAAGTYSVTITDANGCSITATITLDQPLVLEMPTGYSPNNDGFNDAFVIHGIEAYPDNHFEVYNRWGNLVYEADKYQNTWRGTSDTGDTLPDGTYFVILTINNSDTTLKGYVDLRH